MIQKILKNAFRQLGVDIRMHTATSTPTAQIVTALKHFEIDLILDVGANTGQFSSEVRREGYEGNIVSFEPLSEAYDSLRKNSQADGKWIIHPRCAIGDCNGESEINIAGNSASSSLLPMLDSHLSVAPHTAYVGKELVPIRTLDIVVPDYVAKFKNPFLKIDTQGFEWQVLNGAQNVLPKMRGVLIELSLLPLYEGQRLWLDIIDRLESEGFVLWALQQGFIDPHNARTLQMDGIFFRHGDLDR